MPPESNSSPREKHEFPTTQWSVVLALSQTDPQRAESALQKLCGTYWYPIYAFIRQKGHDSHAAEDLTQAFFQFALSRGTFQKANPEKGRFRTFVLSTLENFLHNQWDWSTAQKRGGGRHVISLDEAKAEKIYAQEPADLRTPDKSFERRWAAVLVGRVLDQLRQEYEERGKGPLCLALQPFMTGEPTAAIYESIGLQVGVEPGAVKVALHRARRRFGELLRHEVAHTVSGPEEVEAEIRHLLAAICE